MNNKLYCKPIMLPIDGHRSFLIKGETGRIFMTERPNEYQLGDPQHLYLVSFRETTPFEVESDQFLKDGVNYIGNGQWLMYFNGQKNLIEATTDITLAIPLIPSTFIEEWVKNQGKIEKVFIQEKLIEAGDGSFFTVDCTHQNEVIIFPEKESWNREELKFISYEAFIRGKASLSFDEWFDKNY